MPVGDGTGLGAQAPTRMDIARGDVRIEILAQGEGPLIVLLPSLGRGASACLVMLGLVKNSTQPTIHPRNACTATAEPNN